MGQPVRTVTKKIKHKSAAESFLKFMINRSLKIKMPEIFIFNIILSSLTVLIKGRLFIKKIGKKNPPATPGGRK